MAAARPELGKAGPGELDWLQGRWQHSLDDMGLFTVYGDVAIFDRGSALRIKCDEHGRLYAWGWVMSSELSSGSQVVWRRPDDESADLIAMANRLKSSSDNMHWREWHTKRGTCAWRRVSADQVNICDRFAKLPPGGLPGFPERVSMFAVPPPADTPSHVRPWRLLVYGGCLTIGWPSGDVYARTMVDRLGERGVYTEVIGCGVSAHTSDELAGSMWRRDLYDKMGMRGEGILRLLKKQGPFDLVLIMVGIADMVRGQTGNSIVEMHRACHRLGARTVAISIPPSWHDRPEDMHPADAERARRLDENFGFVSAKKVAKSKEALNKSLLDLTSESGKVRDLPGHHGHCAFFVDTSSIIPCDKDHRSFWETADFIHLTSWGYQCLGWGVGEQLAPLLESMGAAEGAGGAEPSKLAIAEPGSGPVWRVRGGKKKGGLIVRQDMATDSLFHSGRLGTGALLEELELRGDRLHFRKISGDGPAGGWVTIRTATGYSLVERCVDEGGEGRSPSEPDQEPSPAGSAQLPEEDGEEEPEAGELELPEPAEPEEAGEPEAEEAAPATKAKGKIPMLGPSTNRIWRVVGGQSGLGLVVRHGKSKNSMAHTIRVGNGSLLEEIELCGERLHYRMRCGNGPFSGWVSVRMNGRALLERENEWEGQLDSKKSPKSQGGPRPAEKPPPALEAPAKPKPPRLWRCVFEPRIVMRQKPSTSGTPVGLVEHGDEVAVEADLGGGWLKVEGWGAYVLAEHEELGTLLRPISRDIEAKK